MHNRCAWVGEDSEMIEYHDREWGLPVHDDRKHFEFLLLDAFQAGLSWKTILKRREGFRAAFDDFDPEVVALYDEKKLEDLLTDIAIIRNRMKIQASVKNAKAFLKVQNEFGSFDSYIWHFTDGVPIKNTFNSYRDIPAKTERSDRMSKDLKKRGFSFVGSTICYAYMQAAGLVNDHETGCFRYPMIHSSF